MGGGAGGAGAPGLLADGGIVSDESEADAELQLATRANDTAANDTATNDTATAGRARRRLRRLPVMASDRTRGVHGETQRKRRERVRSEDRTRSTNVSVCDGYQPLQPSWSGGSDWMRSATMICSSSVAMAPSGANSSPP